MLVKKYIVENPTNSFELKLPLRVAFEIGLPRDSQFVVKLACAPGGAIDEDEKVLLVLKASP